MQQETRKIDNIDAVRAYAPTDPDAFLLWSSQRRREEGKFELTRGRVVCNMIWASRSHTRVCANILGTLSRLLDSERFDIGAADFAVRTKVGVRSPDIVVKVLSPLGGLDAELAMAAIFRGIPDAPTPG